VKKIPFLLEIDQQEKALGFAMDSGDPNIIEKVFSEILKKYRGGSYFDMLEKVNKIEDCIRHLRNYAKKMRDSALLGQIMDFQAKKQQQEAATKQIDKKKVHQINLTHDFTEPRLLIEDSFHQPSLLHRFKRLKASGESLIKNYKNDYYSQLVGELEEVNKLQEKFYKGHPNDETIMRSSLAEFITKKLTGEKLSSSVQTEMRKLRQTLSVPEPVYYTIAFRAACLAAQRATDAKEQADKWQLVEGLIGEKNSQVPYLTMGELCLEGGNKKLAILAIRKEKRYEQRFNMLCDAEAWLEAVEEVFANKRLAKDDFSDNIDRIRREGPAFVEDFIKEAEKKRGR